MLYLSGHFTSHWSKVEARVVHVGFTVTTGGGVKMYILEKCTCYLVFYGKDGMCSSFEKNLHTSINFYHLEGEGRGEGLPWC